MYGGAEALSHEMRVILWELADVLTIADTAQEYIETSAESLVSARKQKAIATKNAQPDRLIRLIPLLHSLSARHEQSKPAAAGQSLAAYLASPDETNGSDPA